VNHPRKDGSFPSCLWGGRPERPRRCSPAVTTPPRPRGPWPPSPGPELAARIYVIRECLDILWDQSDRDGAEPFRAIGTLKVELITLENQLRTMDRATNALAPAWQSAALESPEARERLEAASEALAAERQTLAEGR
jgi:hypothetical protein